MKSLLVPSLLVHHRLTHTPWSAKDAVHSPASVRTTPTSQSGPTLSLLLNVTVQAPHTYPMVSPRMPCTPLRVCAPPPLPNPGQHPHSLMLNVTEQTPHTHTMVSPRMPCTPLRVCTPSSGFPIWANTLTAVKCNCAGSTHTPHGQLKDAVHSPASVRTILWLPNPGQHHHPY